MFSTLIVTLTVAAIDGLPQPQYLMQYLPVILAPQERSSNVNTLYDESDFLNYDVSSIYKRPGEKARLTVEPIKINRGLTESEIANDEANRLTFTRVEDSYTGSPRHVRLRNGFDKNRMAYIKQLIERREGNTHKPNDVVTENARLIQNTDTSTLKPVTVLKNSFSSNADTEQDNTMTSIDSNKRNQIIYRNRTQKLASMPRNRISHSLNRKNIPLQNESNSRDANTTFTKHIIAEVIDEPIMETLNGNNSKNPVIELIEKSTQKVVNSSEPENGLRNGLYTPVSDEEDRWIWGTTEKVETTTPDIENRVSFDGGSCPTGKVKIAGICVVPDKTVVNGLPQPEVGQLRNYAQNLPVYQASNSNNFVGPLRTKKSYGVMRRAESVNHNGSGFDSRVNDAENIAPDVDNRDSFNGDKCPTGYKRDGKECKKIYKR
ncbi:unnamed protein product [Diatraea saccharalis]|uniref:Uncharacterized protein n=1 Tax=Diatraea saccharalis TaxID=40085 RepID=A0A9N9RBR3_9NEOP|nr:unnamed protein product [Diatraea saccharalis]